MSTTRRTFLKSSLATAGTVALPWHLAPVQSPARYRRYSVTSPQGQKALASYARGIQAMLKLPASDPHNWFRNAFVHLMDCPHGNWWFYVWHRGYVGYFEQTIRTLSGDPTFAMPYWDWTQLPEIPQTMFDGVLTPTDAAFAPFTKDIATFTAFLQPSLKSYWDALDKDQRAQLDARGYSTFDLMWKDVTGFTDTPPPPHVDPTNTAFAETPIARYLTRQNPKLSDDVAKDVSPFIVYSGLLPTDFYNSITNISFNSSKAPSHNTPPPGRTVFSTLEGLPHNNTHNYIGGVGPIPKGPWGNMTNNLSPVDPIFFLHHSNMDRLWDVWTRKQQAMKLPWLPCGDDLTTYAQEPFLFYIDGSGKPVGQANAIDYVSCSRFQYDYEPGFGEAIVKPVTTLKAKRHVAPVQGMLQGNSATLKLSANALNDHLAASAPASLVALVTVPRPMASNSPRNFDVLVGAPAGDNQTGPASPYYAGTIAFFGGMMHMHGMSEDATFLVPLPQKREAFPGLLGGPHPETQTVSVSIRVVPSGGGASVLKAATVQAY